MFRAIVGILGIQKKGAYALRSSSPRVRDLLQPAALYMVARSVVVVKNGKTGETL